MKVFKFGGASVNSAEGVKNLATIVEQELGKGGELFVVVSAMGKTTNALEKVTEQFMAGERDESEVALEESKKFHRPIIDGLFGENAKLERVEKLWSEIEQILAGDVPPVEEYDRWYDRIVSYGEMISTTIIAEYLTAKVTQTHRLDMRKCFLTDLRHRDANVDIKASTPLLLSEMKAHPSKLFVGQGFIGATPYGDPTTIGREGSDYSAAVAAYILNAESLTIWKDVIGILNADPRLFPDAQFIPELTYLEAIELAYSGAQIIHPKTIKPLQNKHIPLYVRPFGDLTKPGSVIKSRAKSRGALPTFTIKHDQVFMTIRPKDFSFVLEDRFASIFILLERYRVKINLIQSSAVNLSLSIDNSRHIPTVVQLLRKDGYSVAYNKSMELLTIRGDFPDSVKQKCDQMPNVYLTQQTRRMIRVVRKKQERTESIL